MRRVANPGGDEYGPGELQDAAEAVADGDEISYQGASSSVTFDDIGDPADAGYDVWEFADGGTETIDTVAFEGEGPGGEMADDSPGGTDREVMVAMLLPETGDLGELGSPMIQAGEPQLGDRERDRTRVYNSHPLVEQDENSQCDSSLCPTLLLPVDSVPRSETQYSHEPREDASRRRSLHLPLRIIRPDGRYLLPVAEHAKDEPRIVPFELQINRRDIRTELRYLR
ncbi:branched-chain/neutral amino acids amide ABC transporter periplasmic substrate-binding protein 1 [Natrialba aegyptia DSM 13077]|uniref:Branched-chain/neutral amino acids amide ABC transporter periplasmic substrate-binding protein 1 n=1 Tax=Natrialba aegyptia DSM 13077 TaxID=1227491 RepID=M0BDR9_9EURY|nr:branched-chain/neutral amino acids amide ABC transporter periplasmic substrate-binding protein 1 [Natrialba aegyptia DSM 13077]